MLPTKGIRGDDQSSEHAPLGDAGRINPADGANVDGASMHRYLAEYHVALRAYSSCRRSQKGESASSRPLGARSRIG